MINDPRQLQCPGLRYTVQSGDTFFNIAGRYGITVQSLVNANPQIADPSRIVPGQVICIPVRPAPECPGQLYVVRPGDTLGAIAQRFGVSVQAILGVNPQITNANVILVGQEICIPVQPAPVRDCAVVLTLSVRPLPEE